MALVQAMVKKVCTIDFLKNYTEILKQLTDKFRTNVPDEFVASMVLNQLLDDRDWTIDTFSFTGSGGKEKTYSAPNSAAYVMIPNDSDVAKARELIEAVLEEKADTE